MTPQQGARGCRSRVLPPASCRAALGTAGLLLALCLPCAPRSLPASSLLSFQLLFWRSRSPAGRFLILLHRCFPVRHRIKERARCKHAAIGQLHAVRS